MLRTLWLLSLAGLMLAATSSKSHAQIHSGDVRLYLDSGFVTFTSDRRNADDPDSKGHVNTTNVSLLGSGGLGLAYVVNQYIVPGIYFSLQHQKVKAGGETVGGREISNDEVSSTTVWEIRPYLEVPFNASSRFVVHAIAGLSIMRPFQGAFWTDNAIGVGPIVGIGGHGFVTPHASLDASVLFRGAFVKDDDADAPDDPKFRQLSVLFMLGASYWL